MGVGRFSVFELPFYGARGSARLRGRFNVQGFRIRGLARGAGSSGFQSSRAFRDNLESGSFRKIRVPYFGVLIIRILSFRVLY